MSFSNTARLPPPQSSFALTSLQEQYNSGLSNEKALEAAITASLQTSTTKPSGLTAFFWNFLSQKPNIEREYSDGLYNLGNTCWLNATLQAIFKPINAYSQALQEAAQTNANAQLVVKVIEASKKPPSEIIDKQLHDDLKALKGKMGSYSTGRQEDPSEVFYTHLTTLLGIDEYLPKITTQTYIHAKDDERLGHFNNPQEVRSLILAHSESTSLKEAIAKQYMQKEDLGPNERVDFDGSSYPHNIFKVDYLLTDSIPDSLLIQAPRFKEVHTTNPLQPKIRAKNNRPIDFDDNIELPLYDTYGTCAKMKLTLSLQAVIGHMGTLGAGHYVAYQRQDDGTYICFDDLTVSVLTEEEAKAKICMQGYIGVYKKTKVEEIDSSNVHLYPTLTDALKHPPILPNPPQAIEPEPPIDIEPEPATIIAPSIQNIAPEEAAAEEQLPIPIPPVSTAEKASQIARSIIEHTPARTKRWGNHKISTKYGV